jgi:hypothetical protein
MTLNNLLLQMPQASSQAGTLTGCSVVAYRLRKLFSIPEIWVPMSPATPSSSFPARANFHRSWVQLVVICRNRERKQVKKEQHRMSKFMSQSA